MLSFNSELGTIYTRILCRVVLRGTTFICTLLSLRRDSPPKSSPTFFVRPRSSVGRVTVDLIRRSWVRFPPRSKEFFLYLVRFPVSRPFPRANAQWVFHGFLIVLCSAAKRFPHIETVVFSVRPRIYQPMESSFMK